MRPIDGRSGFQQSGSEVKGSSEKSDNCCIIPSITDWSRSAPTTVHPQLQGGRHGAAAALEGGKEDRLPSTGESLDDQWQAIVDFHEFVRRHVPGWVRNLYDVVPIRQSGPTFPEHQQRDPPDPGVVRVSQIGEGDGADEGEFGDELDLSLLTVKTFQDPAPGYTSRTRHHPVFLPRPGYELTARRCESNIRC